METILVPVDFSEQSLNAIDAGFQLAKMADAKLILLNVIEIGKGYLDASGEEIEPGEDEHDFIKKAKRNIAGKLEKMCGQLKGVTVSSAVKIGNTYANISKVIDDNKVDLVIMGSKGASGIKELLIGSNTEKVVRLARVPVLTIKEKADLSKVRSIVLVIEPEEKPDQILKDIKYFQLLFQATLHLLIVNTPNNWRTSRKLNEELKALAVEHRLEDYTLNIYDAESLENGVLYFSSDIDTDIISLASNKKVGLGRIFGGDVAEDIVNHSKRPILTFSRNL